MSDEETLLLVGVVAVGAYLFKDKIFAVVEDRSTLPPDSSLPPSRRDDIYDPATPGSAEFSTSGVLNFMLPPYRDAPHLTPDQQAHVNKMGSDINKAKDEYVKKVYDFNPFRRKTA